MAAVRRIKLVVPPYSQTRHMIHRSSKSSTGALQARYQV